MCCAADAQLVKDVMCVMTTLTVIRLTQWLDLLESNALQRLSACNSRSFARSRKISNYCDVSIVRILSHRGIWREVAEKNSIEALARSLDRGFGLETDVRDSGGGLVISHDLPIGGELAFDAILHMVQRRNLPLAVNIKSDGLAVLVKKAMKDFCIADWFAFDMSVPDMRGYLDEGLPVFARVSEVESDPPWVEEVAGIWFDSFEGNNYEVERIGGYLRDGKRVCIVSPELHGKPYLAVWRDFVALSGETELMLCTDHPEEARRLFLEDG